MLERADTVTSPTRYVHAIFFAIAVLVGSPPARANDAACTSANAMATAHLTRWLETTNATALLTDGTIVPEGAPWSSQGVVFETTASSLTYDLGDIFSIREIYLQGDAGTAFTLLVSADARSWHRLSFLPMPGSGLRSRSSSIEPIDARYVRFGEPSNAGAVATELQLRCSLPASLTLPVLDRDPSPPPRTAPDSWRSRAWARLTGVPVLTPAQALVAKLALSVCAALLLLVGARSRWSRARDALLVVVAVASFAGYYNWGAYRFPDYAHPHELFHYVVGGKYFNELGYTRLYDCVNAVDAEQGLRARAESRPVRDLRDNVIVDGKASLAHEAECRHAFTPERWDAFARDVAWFRDHATPAAWDHTLRDHGFNPSPAWAMVGSTIANLRPASRGFVGYADSMTSGALAMIDPLLVLVVFFAIAWAFGWRVACVCAVVFGGNPLASFLWTGGAYLRQDWLVLTVVGVACLKKERFAIGGASLAYAAALRVFPAVILAVIAMRLAWTGWRERRVDRELARTIAGAAAASVAILVVSSVVTGGLHTWVEFARNTAKHSASPSVNLVGLRTLLSFRPSTRADVLFDPSLLDPFARVVEARRANFAHALPVFVLALFAFVALLFRAVRRTSDPWVLACLGAAAIPIVTELSCYYSSFLVVVALLLHARARVPVAVLSACAVLLALQLTLDNDVLYACASAALVVLSAWTVWECGSAPRAAIVHVAPSGARSGVVRGALWATGGVAVLVVIGACQSRDVLLDADGACEARWTELAAALHARAALVDAEGAAPARRHASAIHPAGDDFTDAAKMAAFETTQAELRSALGRFASPADEGEIARADQQVVLASDRYDDAVVAFDVALDRTKTARINRANGHTFLPRVPLGRP
jgi:hypothetical protein